MTCLRLESPVKKIAFVLASLVLAPLAFAAQPLLSPQELQAQLSDPNVRVIDIREPQAYAAAHIPGAVSAPYGQWRGPSANPGELPALPKLTTLVQSLGLTPTTHAVVVSSGVDSTDFGAAARVYWTLKVLGLKELSILNGGVKAWADARLPQNDRVATVAASSFQPRLDMSQIATTEEVIRRVKAGDSALIDARPAAFYNGETKAPAAKAAGTLPGAVNVSYDKWFAPGSAVFVPADQARQIAASSKIDPAKETVSFCNTGHWAATNWFAMSEVLGRKNVKLYPASMVEWSQDANLPMANAPTRGQQLLQDAKGWLNRITH